MADDKIYDFSPIHYDDELEAQLREKEGRGPAPTPAPAPVPMADPNAIMERLAALEAAFAEERRQRQAMQARVAEQDMTIAQTQAENVQLRADLDHTRMALDEEKRGRKRANEEISELRVDNQGLRVEADDLRKVKDAMLAFGEISLNGMHLLLTALTNLSSTRHWGGNPRRPGSTRTSPEEATSRRAPRKHQRRQQQRRQR